jgi:hypothetical protein
VLKGSDVPVGATGHEDQRLAYVALTRARARVYLPVLPPKTKQPKPRGGWLAVYGAMHDALTICTRPGGRRGRRRRGRQSCRAT